MTSMRNDDDLEALLRGTLVTAGDSIDSGPTWTRGDDELLPVRHRRRWIAPVAAAAAAAVVAGAVVAARESHNDKNSPATQLPTVTQSVSPTPSPTKLGADVKRASCAVPLPGAWAAAAARTTTTDSDGVVPLAVFPDGRVVVARDLGNVRDVALLGADGHAESIYTVTSYADQVYGAQVEGNTVLIQVSKLIKQHGMTTSTISALEVIDPGLGQLQIADGRHGTVDGGAMLNGHVYYDVRPNAGSEHGTIYDLALDTYGQKPAKAVYTGNVSAPKLFGGGISWAARSYRIAVPRAVPAPVASETRTQPTNRDPAVTDGTSWAWEDNSNGIAWYRAGQPGPVHVRLGAVTAVFAVTGTYVVFQLGDDLRARVLDVRTGATAILPGVSPTLEAGSGIVAVAVRTGAAKNSPTKMLRLDTTKLPGLTC